MEGCGMSLNGATDSTFIETEGTLLSEITEVLFNFDEINRETTYQ